MFHLLKYYKQNEIKLKLKNNIGILLKVQKCRNLVPEKYCMTNSIPYTALGLGLVLYGLVNIAAKHVLV